MSYHYERGGYSGFNRRGGFQFGPRINENQVPQSKHTIFIRGLGGDVTTSDIEEYIGERVGKIKFDFVKQAQDRSKIFVAVRFEKREEAKEFMETYSERDFMGYRCELSWFRDIRRYCAYQRSKQVRSNSQRRRRRSDSDGSRHASESPERRSKSRESRGSRSGSRASRKSRSGSRSTDQARDKSRSRSRGSDRSNRSNSSRRSRSRSRSNERRARSTSRGSRKVDSRNDYDSSRERSDVEEDKRRNRDRQSRTKRRRQYSNSDDSHSDDDKGTKRKSELPQIPLPPAGVVQKTPTKTPKTDAFIPPPTVDMEVDSPKNSPPQHVNPYQAYKPQEPQVQSTTYVVPIKEESTPKPIIRETAPQPGQNPSYPIPTHTASYNTQPAPAVQYQQPYPQVQNYVQPAPAAPVVVAPPAPAPAQAPPQPQAPAPAPQPAFVPRQVGKIEILMPAALPAPPPAPVPVPAPSIKTNGSSKLDTTLLPCTHQLFGHLTAFQSALLSTVKYEPPVKNEDDGLSTLRLSSMNNDDDENSEDLKILEREDKLKILTDEQKMRFHIKKKQFEAAFRNDCETYAVVTRALLSKDETLQFGLKMSLMENMEDLYKKMMQRVDDLLDQLLA